jgi:hypothetical protein
VSIGAPYDLLSIALVSSFSRTSARSVHDDPVRHQTHPSFRTVAAAAVVLVTVLAACGSDGGSTADSAGPVATPVIDPGDGGDYSVELDPAQFASVVDNPYLPTLPGARWVYEATNEDGDVERTVVEVLDETKTVMGVEAIVVHDVVDIGGEVVEDTYDWFAQDADGTVWYLGEDTTAYDNGAASKEGSWEAGVGGALPGVVMWGDPSAAEGGYRQEYLAGRAEDMGEVITTSGSVSTPAGDFDDVVVTRDWTPLEPDLIEQKTYASGVGLVGESTEVDGEEIENVVLVEFTPAG